MGLGVVGDLDFEALLSELPGEPVQGLVVHMAGVCTQHTPTAKTLQEVSWVGRPHDQTPAGAQEPAGLPIHGQGVLRIQMFDQIRRYDEVPLPSGQSCIPGVCSCKSQSDHGFPLKAGPADPDGRLGEVHAYDFACRLGQRE